MVKLYKIICIYYLRKGRNENEKKNTKGIEYEKK